jgi:TonB family protein
VLSDTKGFNVKPYLKEVVGIVRSNWYFVIPNVVRAPKFEQGYVAVDFRVMKDGQIKDVKYHVNSEDPKLDRAAYAAITGSDPLPPFPANFSVSLLN